MPMSPSAPEESTVDDAIRALDAVRRAWLRRPRVTAVDVGFKMTGDELTDTVALRVHVERKLPVAELPQSEVFNDPTEGESTVDGFPIDVIEAVYGPSSEPLDPTGAIDHEDPAAVEANDRKAAIDPLMGGISCGRRRANVGTLGALVFDRTSGDPMILSSWHVLAGTSAAIGDEILQPGAVDGGEEAVASLTRMVLNSAADAAVATLNGARGYLRHILGVGEISGIEGPTLGMSVLKSGRATGVTEGVVDGVSMTVPINYGDGGIVTLDNQIHIAPPKPWPAVDFEVSGRGDSGSVWVNASSKKAIGLHLASDAVREPTAEFAVCSPMQPIADRLDFDFAGGEERRSQIRTSDGSESRDDRPVAVDNSAPVVRGQRYAGFRNDDPRLLKPDGKPRNLLEEDQLGIEPHVKAFALLMSSTELQPPLATGLFGDWGSGKTYFMRALRQEIDRLSKAARDSPRPQHELKVYGNVAQIEFNAWHYVDADLWASLADYIFTNLKIAGDDASDAQTRRDAYVAALRKKGAALRQVETERRQLEDRLALASDELERIRQRTRDERRELGSLVRAVVAEDDTRRDANDIIARTGARGGGERATELRNALQEAHTVAGRGSRTVNLLAGRYGSTWFAVALIALLLGPIALAVSGLLDLSAVSRVASTLAAFAAGAVALIRSGSHAAASTLDTIESITEKLDHQIEEDTDVQSRRDKVVELDGDLEDARTRENALREKLAKLNQDLDKLEPERQLAEFILSRRDSDDYRKHLGLASVIRRDFDELTSLIEAFNRHQLDPSSVRPDPGDVPRTQQINRIVLYIDDLDRCPPSKVVDVLQAVHLLLAFPLFVVVVGVDARWLSRSLEQHYEGLLGGGEHDPDGGSSANPHDYLEKIFQIPFWLRPMTPGDTGRLLDDLTKPTDSSQHDAGSSSEMAKAVGIATDAPTSVETSSPGDHERRGDKPERHEPRRDEEKGDEPHVEPDDVGPVEPAPSERGVDEHDSSEDLTTTPIEITLDERESMDAIIPLLGRSPRSLTRFVNVYRLIKAAGLNSGLSADSRPAGPEVTMFLLAIVTGLPAISPTVFRALAADTYQTLQELVKHTDPATPTGTASDRTQTATGSQSRRSVTRQTDGAPARRQWRRLSAWVDDHPDWADQDVSDWRELASRISRYSYRIEQF